jgi:hypothetical protein
VHIYGARLRTMKTILFPVGGPGDNAHAMLRRNLNGQRTARHRLFINLTQKPHFDIDEALTFSHVVHAVDFYENVASFAFEVYSS